MLDPASRDPAAACRTSVRVRDLPLLADIGINPDEIGRRQPLVITVELELDQRPIGGIGDTVDYRRIAAAAEDLAAVHIPLIETFAQELARQCLAMSGVHRARVAIDKPFAITRGMAGVEIVMTNSQEDGR
ncbi:dihydroneopterin aldolase [Croceicoccus marinus]|uniref:Dihydroneopterin aldolase n=1 Tax=Croceicoccus marinus TaxID=450378 RepID=A0A1Z1FH06_9SPHN|nr:dihydroneopterin aldolase [Croceicoccus marinus]ARU18035.1 dihydroneopterin aldolase [Croceicoccus marinus]QNE07540.1 dihydroneopterin aldolase [Croceicoccus marinus]